MSGGREVESSGYLVWRESGGCLVAVHEGSQLASLRGGEAGELGMGGNVAELWGYRGYRGGRINGLRGCCC